jgi:hypothetical protein
MTARAGLIGVIGVILQNSPWPGAPPSNDEKEIQGVEGPRVSGFQGGHNLGRSSWAVHLNPRNLHPLNPIFYTERQMMTRTTKILIALVLMIQLVGILDHSLLAGRQAEELQGPLRSHGTHRGRFAGGGL